MKIVINRCWGGFSLSQEAADYLGLEHGYVTVNRDDPKLVECVEALGDRANGKFAELKVVEIPDGIEWYIDNYEGMEKIHEVHRSWY